MADVSLQNVSKIFPGNVIAVREFCLDIPSGQLVVLVGPSGCGKTTTLRLIAGLEQVSSGTIRIGDRGVQDLPPRVRDVAMVFQSHALYPHMTVHDNMAFALRLRKVAKASMESRIAETAASLGLSQLLQRRPAQLSGGQRQRVALGRAMVRQPRLFLFDEPLSNLDAGLRVELRGEIKRLHRRLGRTTLYVTHDQAEAMTMGDIVVVMKDGAIQQIADPETVYDRPANLFVASFIGTPPMNLIPGQIRRENDRFRFDGDLVKLILPRRWQNRIADYAGKPVVFGVRPEDVQPRQSTSALPRLTATVDAVEPLGAETHLFLSCGDDRLVSRVTSRGPYQLGTQIDVSVDLEKSHLFDSASGLAIP